MIKLSKEDLKFKKSAEYRDRKENILNAANILGMIINPDKQRNMIEVVVSFLGLGSSSYGLSDYVCSRISMFEREEKTNEEIIDWLRRMALSTRLQKIERRKAAAKLNYCSYS